MHYVSTDIWYSSMGFICQEEYYVPGTNSAKYGCMLDSGETVVDLDWGIITAGWLAIDVADSTLPVSATILESCE